MTADALWRRGDASYPGVLLRYPEAPKQLFARGDAGALGRRRVAIVGTRRCTEYGRKVATRFARDLAEAGVAIVSGLAIGIDGAAHEGALAVGGQPIGVVGSGLDIVYPLRHRSLWQRVGEHGLLLSEFPPGEKPSPWNFPRRNRIIAGLAEIVVVVESAAAGGSLITAELAIARDITVMAVPGPVTSTASAGTNRMLVDGIPPAVSADDVLLVLGLQQATASAQVGAAPPVPLQLSLAACAVLEILDFAPTPSERLLAALGMTPGQLSVALDELAMVGQATGGGGWWSRTQSS